MLGRGRKASSSPLRRPGTRLRRSARYLLLVGTAAALAACGGGEGLTGPTTGTLEVASSTSGAELDPDGYTVQIDTEPARGIGIAGTIRSTGVAPGTHTVQLGGLASNCMVSGDNPRSVSVARGETATVTFEVKCSLTTGSLTVTATTTGSTVDPDGYSVTVDSSDRATLGANAAVTLDGLAPGPHSVGLTALAAVCQAGSENPQSVMVTIGATSTIAFDVSCLAPQTEEPPRGPELPPPLPPSRGQVFFVATTGADTNPGTLRAPWRSIQKAMDNLQSDQLAYVRAGTYGTKADTHTWQTGCSPSAPCTIRSYPGERPVIHGQLQLEGSYLRLSGFIIEGPLGDQTVCDSRRQDQIDLSDSHDVELSNNEIRYNDYHAGITGYRMHHIQILNNWIHDNGRFLVSVDPCGTGIPANNDHGIYWGSTAGGGNLIANNLVAHNRSRGILFFSGPISDGVSVVQNTIVDNGDAGIVVNGAVDNIRIVNNVVAFNGQPVPRAQIRVLAGTGHVVTRNLTYDPDTAFAGVEGTTGVSDNDLADPLFIDRVAANYHVSTGSPAIDRALTAWALTIDRDGVHRPVGVAPDLGAYER